MKLRTEKLVLVLVAVAALSACSSVKKELGVGRNSPDEFAVVKRAPLTLPPEYALRPPANPGEAPAPQADTTLQAKAALLGADKATTQKGAADSAFMNKAGVTAATPDIRRVIDQENGYISLQNRTVADKLIFWNDEVPERIPSSVVDPAAEAARIQKNKEEGKPVNEGKVPVIEKKSGTLGKIF
jgi:hypothetical protein